MKERSIWNVQNKLCAAEHMITCVKGWKLVDVCIMCLKSFNLLPCVCCCWAGLVYMLISIFQHNIRTLYFIFILFNVIWIWGVAPKWLVCICPESYISSKPFLMNEVKSILFIHWKLETFEIMQMLFNQFRGPRWSERANVGEKREALVVLFQQNNLRNMNLL